MLLIQWRDRPEPFLRPELLRAAYEKIFENVVVLGWRQRLVADPALEHPVNATRLGPHPNDLIARLTTRACKIAGIIVFHALILHGFAK